MVMARLEKTKLILEDARSLCDKLDMVIVEDDIIDEDEIALINVIRQNILGYDALLQKVLEDNVVDDDELAQINAYELKLTEAVQQQIAKDGVISRAEDDMLNVLFDCLKSLNSLEDY
ncbi:MAG: hypothetical protein ACXAE3_04140 [Candidatus Kariarchaeaceae archaeon]|jgi:hypothetical protein